MRLLNLFLIAFLFAGLVSCVNDDASEEAVENELSDETVIEDEALEEEPERIIMEGGGLRLVEIDDSPVYADAHLTMEAPEDEAELQPGMVQYNFNVMNYELGIPTGDADNKMLANSDHGQHIHLIVNNNPYTAHYEPQFEKELPAGNQVILAFLSRSYHESVKNPDAYVLRQVKVGDAAAEQVDLSQPHMFYSRPKGSYAGTDTKRILLDFYLVNTDLTEDGNKIRATINGNEFMIDKWAPFAIEGLPMGETTITLELLDAQGNRVPSPYNPVTRTVTLSEADS